MKNIFKIALCTLAFPVIWGCDDFLTEKPTTSLFNTHVYANENSAYVALVACYGMFSSSNHYGMSWTEILPPSGIFVTTGLDVLSTSLGSSRKNIVDMAKYKFDANNSGIEDMYSGVYATIAVINDLIYNVESSSMSEEAKQRLIGEARFLRAVSYFDIVRVWGKAPLALSVATTIEEAHRAKSGVKEIFDAIIEDFKYAEIYMPEKNEQVIGKPFNYAATAYLSKVYAHMATSEYMFEGETDPYSSADRTSFWQESYNHAKKVYDDKMYSLVPDYANLWRCRTNSTEESIFELQYNMTAGNNDWGFSTIPSQSTYTPKSTTGNNATRIRPSKVIYEWHKAKYTDTVSYDVDPRINENYVVTEYFKNSLASSPGGQILVYPSEGVSGSGERFPVLIKFCDPEWTAGGNSNMNWIMYRYADLLLVLAEAANEIGDPENIKFTMVNEVLKRARNTGSLIPADWKPEDYPDKDTFRDAVMKERLFEMPLEGHEWFDVRRRGKEWFVKIAEEYNAGVDKYTFSADTIGGEDRRLKVPVDAVSVRKLMYLPIPYAEINNNRGMTPADQNYGYN
jgi:hypothetical protein